MMLLARLVIFTLHFFLFLLLLYLSVRDHKFSASATGIAELRPG
jgi:hypothetical protein